MSFVDSSGDESRGNNRCSQVTSVVALVQQLMMMLELAGWSCVAPYLLSAYEE